MLQGFLKNKLTSLVVGAEGRVPSEDLLTAVVFGVVAYVEPQLAARMLRLVFGEELFKWPSEQVVEIEIDLWPRSLKSRSAGWIEPDVIIDVFVGDQPNQHRFIVESKWNAPLGPNQALTQWRECRLEDGETWHVFPVR